LYISIPHSSSNWIFNKGNNYTGAAKYSSCRCRIL
jgi:hypothetical protein